MTFIAEKLKKYLQIMEILQVPAMKKNEKTTLKCTVQDYIILFGKEIDDKNIWGKWIIWKRYWRCLTAVKKAIVPLWEERSLKLLSTVLPQFHTSKFSFYSTACFMNRTYGCTMYIISFVNFNYFLFCFVLGKCFKLIAVNYSGEVSVSETFILSLLVYIQNACKFWIIIFNLRNQVFKEIEIRMKTFKNFLIFWNLVFSDYN